MLNISSVQIQSISGKSGINLKCPQQMVSIDIKRTKSETHTSYLGKLEAEKKQKKKNPFSLKFKFKSQPEQGLMSAKQKQL